MLYSLLENFFDYVEDMNIELYNEFSLQHELGIYLRNNLPEYKVQFERNVSYFMENKDDFVYMDFVKKEIDITVFNEDFSECYAVELKYPRNGQYPEQMYSFIKDIRFTEQLKKAGFKETYCMTMVDISSKPFYTGDKIDHIYSYFRNNKRITGNIYKPTGTEDEKKKFIHIDGEYYIKWVDTCKSRKMYLLKI